MAVIDYVGAGSARVVGLVALIPAWIALQRYTFPHFTGGPLVITVDTLRATLYPMLWGILAWILLNPATTRHFLYRREDWIWRFVLGIIYTIAIPFIFLAAIGLVRTYWLQNPWIADVLLLALPLAWLTFLMAFSLPGTYAGNISEERDEAVEVSEVMSDDSRDRAMDREYAEALSAEGMASHAFDADDQTREAWRQKVLTRQEAQNAFRKERREAHQSRDRRTVFGRLGLAAALLAFILAGLGIAAQSPDVARFLDRYLPVILGTVVVVAFIVGSIVLGARNRSPLSNAMRIMGLVVIAGLLLNFVLLPAADRGLAVVYADFVDDAVASIQNAMDGFGK